MCSDETRDCQKYEVTLRGQDTADDPGSQPQYGSDLLKQRIISLALSNIKNGLRNEYLFFFFFWGWGGRRKEKTSPGYENLQTNFYVNMASNEMKREQQLRA